MSLLDAIQQKLQPEQVFERGRPDGGWKRGNQHLIGDCPLCQPGSGKGKLYIHLNKPVWDCKVCGGNGSWYAWVEQTEGHSRQEAVISLAGMAGIKLDAKTQERVEAEQRRSDLLEVAGNTMSDWLLNGDDVVSRGLREYLAGRGYSREEMGGMGLGAHIGVRELSERMQFHGFTDADCKAAGLYTPGFGDTHTLAIMWRKSSGIAEAITMRSITGVEPKYKNSGGMSKDGVLGLGLARRLGWAVLVESQLDALRLAHYGVPAIAVGGTSIMRAHAQAIIAAGLQKLILLFDQHEEPGRKATRRAVLQLCHEDMPLYVAGLPDGFKDPDELLSAQGLPAVQAELDSATSAARWLAQDVMRNSGESEQARGLALRDARRLLDGWKWASDRQDFAQGVSDALGTPVWRSGIYGDIPAISNPDLERAVLAEIVCDAADAVPRVISQLRASDFTLPRNRLILSALRRLNDAGRVADVLTVSADLHDRGELEAAGPEYVAGLGLAARGTENLEQHVVMLGELSQARMLQGLGMALASRVSSGEPVNALCSEYRQAFDTISDGAQVDSDESMADVMREYAKSDQASGIGWTTGFDHWDELTGGHRPGTLEIGAARLGVGKSRVYGYSLACAHRAGAKVGVISLDMGSEISKYIATSALSIRGIGQGHSRSRQAMMEDAASYLEDGFRFARYNCSSFPQIDRLVRRWVRSGVNIVLIDQAQNIDEYIRAGEGRQQSWQEINSLLSRIKSLAKRLGICVILLHQISREGADNPQIKHLFGSDGFGQIADDIVILHDPSTTDKGEFIHPGSLEPGLTAEALAAFSDQRPLLVNIAKTRGRKGSATVMFDFAAGAVLR